VNWEALLWHDKTATRCRDIGWPFYHAKAVLPNSLLLDLAIQQESNGRFSSACSE